jgi:hypothetical protein
MNIITIFSLDLPIFLTKCYGRRPMMENIQTDKYVLQKLPKILFYLSIYLHWMRLSERPKKQKKKEESSCLFVCLFVCLLSQVGSFVSLLLSTSLYLCV